MQGTSGPSAAAPSEGNETNAQGRPTADSPPSRGELPERPIRRQPARHALRGWREIQVRLQAAPHLALFLDFDGTLVNLRNHPKDVRVPAEVRQILGRLARHANVSVSLVSGRSIASLRALLDAPGVRYFGLQGAEHDGKCPAVSKSALRHLSIAKRAAKRDLGKLAGMWVEDKKLTFSVHYRRASAATVRAAREILAGILERAGNTLHALHGNRVWEVLPAEIRGKSSAVEAVLPSLRRKTAAIYIGDDGTDEVAFAALPGQVTIRVGEKRRTRASYYLHDPGEVLRFLRRVEESLSANSPTA